MAITRTPMVDDDGSGLTGTPINNAWKQEFYNQIDAMQIIGTWTPTDASAAGLTLNVLSARYARTGIVVLIWCHLVYPATASTASAAIGGLPFLNSTNLSGFYQTYGLTHSFSLNPNESAVLPLNPTTFGQRQNVDLSGQTICFAGQYLTY